MASMYIQTKLTLDKNLGEVWNYLERKYKTLDKPGIIRLALDTLAQETKKKDTSCRIFTREEMKEWEKDDELPQELIEDTKRSWSDIPEWK